jgi:hypothetical protein
MRLKLSGASCMHHCAWLPPSSVELLRGGPQVPYVGSSVLCRGGFQFGITQQLRPAALVGSGLPGM